MKAGLAALLFVAGLIEEFASELNLKGSLGIVTSPDEESGGMELASLLDDGLIHGDACLIGEPTYPNHPVIGEKGWLLMRVTIPGEPGHGSLQPLSGISAIRRGAIAVETLARLWDLQATPPEELYPLLYNTEALMHRVLGEYDPLVQILYRPSYNPGIIEGGTAVNSIAERCVIEVDTRVPYGMSTEFVFDVARNLVSSVTPDAIVEPIVPYSYPNWTPVNAAIVQATQFGLEKVRGPQENITNVLLLNSSDARHFRCHGIDTVLYGPGLYHTIHAYDEQVSVESLVESAEIFAEIAIEYLGGCLARPEFCRIF
jgi:succinyl-diaminopimelate desuccinylase